MSVDALPHRIPIVEYAITPWDGIWRPRREYVAQLARRGWPCLYTMGLKTTWELRRDGLKGTPWFGALTRSDGVLVDRPGVFPFDWPGRAIGAMARRWHARRVRGALGARNGRDVIAIASDPQFWPYVESLRPRYLVYYIYDSFAEMPGWNATSERFQHSLVTHADLIVSTTRSLADTLKDAPPDRVGILPNAVRLESFERGRGLPCPEQLAGIPHPRIGYIGNVSPALDFDVMLHVARARPDWHLVFIGWVGMSESSGGLGDPALDAKWLALRALKNVHLIPTIPFEAVPQFLVHMDVNVLWYRSAKDGFWQHGSHIKLYETLAVGKPIVAAGTDAARQFGHVIEIPEGPEQWVTAIARSIDDGGIGTPDARIAIARENSWNARAATLESWLLEMIGAA